jgi:hypothetical protein
MNTPKTILVALLLVSALPAFGWVASHRRAAAAVVSRDPAARVDPALLSRLARAQAAVALAQSSGAASRLPPGF